MKGITPIVIGLALVVAMILILSSMGMFQAGLYPQLYTRGIGTCFSYEGQVWQIIDDTITSGQTIKCQRVSDGMIEYFTAWDEQLPTVQCTQTPPPVPEPECTTASDCAVPELYVEHGSVKALCISNKCQTTITCSSGYIYDNALKQCVSSGAKTYTGISFIDDFINWIFGLLGW